MSIQYTVDQLQRKFTGPPGGPGFARLGEVMRLDGRLDEAIQICQEGLRLRPFQLSGYLVLGKALLDAGRYEDALVQFQGALNIDPRCLAALHYLADIMKVMGTEDAAAGYYRTILDLEPWDTEIRALLEGSAPPASHNYAPPVAPAAVPSEEEDTYHKPEGLVGDVMEINFSEMADFLPAEDPDAMVDPSKEAVSLEEALAQSKESFPPAPSPNQAVQLPSLEDQEMLAAAAATTEEPVPISGQDVEDRLDSLFGSDDTNVLSTPSQAETWVPKEDAPAGLDFRDGGAATATDMMQAMPEEMAPAVDQTQKVFSEEEDLADTMALVIPEEERVSGADIEKRLDDLFSLTEEDGQSTSETSTLEAMPAEEESAAKGMLEERPSDPDQTAWSPLEPFSEPEIPASGALMSTESMLPVGWLADVGDQPRITGADVEAQLDKLFDMEGTSDAMDSRPQASSEDPDRTMTLPAMKPAGKTVEPEEVFFGDGTETVIMPMEDVPDFPEREALPDFNATLELPNVEESPLLDDPEAFGSMVLEDSDNLTETTSIEMIDGTDVAVRLGELFDDEAADEKTADMEMGPPETVETVAKSMESSDSQVAAVPEDGDGYPDEEESPSQIEGGPNVATVTLAEIYFQQGLKEQALQIYRQLLDREPENETVRNRISEIEASKSEGETRGTDGQKPDSDPRRPRPGLKVPKRKK